MQIIPAICDRLEIRELEKCRVRRTANSYGRGFALRRVQHNGVLLSTEAPPEVTKAASTRPPQTKFHHRYSYPGEEALGQISIITPIKASLPKSPRPAEPPSGSVHLSVSKLRCGWFETIMRKLEAKMALSKGQLFWRQLWAGSTKNWGCRKVTTNCHGSGSRY